MINQQDRTAKESQISQAPLNPTGGATSSAERFRPDEGDHLLVSTASQTPSQKDDDRQQTSSDDQKEEAEKRRLWAKPGQWIWIVVLVAIGVTLILRAWRIGHFVTSIIVTDDSYVQGQITSLSPQVSGYVTAVQFTDFQYVRAGQVLFQIDQRLYQAALDEAEAQVEAATSKLSNTAQTNAQDRAVIAQRIADVRAADAATARDVQESRRVDGLASRGSVSEREREQAEAAARASAAQGDKARAALAVARTQVTSTQVSKVGLKADVDRARAQLDTAKVNLANTIIRAPVSGQVSQASVRPGQFVAAGTQLVYLVPKGLWVIANFKETDMRHMYVGQPATLSVDALGGEDFRGRIEQIAPATGTEFSVIKPDNASGNFTKVVRRLPVRIGIYANQSSADRLRPGLSVTAKVDTAGGRDRSRSR